MMKSTTNPADNPLKAVVVELAGPAYGSLDAPALDMLRDFLNQIAEEKTSVPVIIDLSNVHFFGAALIGLLVSTWDKLRSRHRLLAICGITPYGGRLIRELHLNKLFNLHPTQQSALETLGRYPTGSESGGSTKQIRVTTEGLAWDRGLVRVQHVANGSDVIGCEIVPRGYCSNVQNGSHWGF